MNTNYFELNDTLENQKSAILAEAYQAEELREMCDYLEMLDVENEYDELLDLAEYTAETSALTETAIDVREQLLEAIRLLK